MLSAAGVLSFAAVPPILLMAALSLSAARRRNALSPAVVRREVRAVAWRRRCCSRPGSPRWGVALARRPSVIRDAQSLTAVVPPCVASGRPVIRRRLPVRLVAQRRRCCSRPSHCRSSPSRRWSVALARFRRRRSSLSAARESGFAEVADRGAPPPPQEPAGVAAGGAGGSVSAAGRWPARCVAPEPAVEALAGARGWSSSSADGELSSSGALRPVWRNDAGPENYRARRLCESWGARPLAGNNTAGPAPVGPPAGLRQAPASAPRRRTGRAAAPPGGAGGDGEHVRRGERAAPPSGATANLSSPSVVVGTVGSRKQIRPGVRSAPNRSGAAVAAYTHLEELGLVDARRSREPASIALTRS